MRDTRTILELVEGWRVEAPRLVSRSETFAEHGKRFLADDRTKNLSLDNHEGSSSSDKG